MRTIKKITKKTFQGIGIVILFPILGFMLIGEKFNLFK